MYKENKDIILVIFFGFIYYAIVVGLKPNLAEIPIGIPFIIPFFISLFMGFSVRRSSQLVEWPLSFMFGGVLGCFIIIPILIFLGLNLNLIQVGEYFSVVLAWFLGESILVLSGLLVSNLLVAFYDLIFGSLKIQ